MPQAVIQTDFMCSWRKLGWNFFSNFLYSTYKGHGIFWIGKLYDQIDLQVSSLGFIIHEIGHFIESKWYLGAFLRVKMAK